MGVGGLIEEVKVEGRVRCKRGGEGGVREEKHVATGMVGFGNMIEKVRVKKRRIRGWK